MSANFNSNVLFNDLVGESNMSNTLTDKINFFYREMGEYENFLNETIENDVNSIKEENLKEIDVIKKKIEKLKGDQLSTSKKIEQMSIMLEVAQLNTDLKLKKLELEENLEAAEEDYKLRLENHNKDIENKRKDLIKEATICSQFVEKSIKEPKDSSFNNESLSSIIDSLSGAWKQVRDKYLDLIGTERKNIKIFSLRLEELNAQKATATSELEKSESEKNFLQGKIGLNLLENDDSQLINSESEKIDSAKRDIAKIDRDIKKVNIQQDACREKMDIVQTMIDGIIGETLQNQFATDKKIIPDFLSGIKYFGK